MQNEEHYSTILMNNLLDLMVEIYQTVLHKTIMFSVTFSQLKISGNRRPNIMWYTIYNQISLHVH